MDFLLNGLLAFKWQQVVMIIVGCILIFFSYQERT